MRRAACALERQGRDSLLTRTGLIFLLMEQLTDRVRAALAPRYAIEREICRGGMATVDAAQDRRYRRPVAVKALPPHLAASLGPERLLPELAIPAAPRQP